MGDQSGIEWTDATWNPVSGCVKVSRGCKHCYAEREWPRLAGRGQPYEGRAFTNIALHPERLDQPLRWRKPRRVFVNSLSDLFHEEVPDSFIDQVFAVMALASAHTFQVLTKRPERMRAYLHAQDRAEGIGHEAMLFYETHGGRGDCSLPAGLIHGPGKVMGHPTIPNRPQAWPLPNVWLGVSVEDQETADQRIPLLLDTPATMRFVSAEPLLGPLDLTPYLQALDAEAAGLADDPLAATLLAEGMQEGNASGPGLLHWVIAGGESGPNARPMHPDWVRSLRDQCREADVAFFFKQWGEWHPMEGPVPMPGSRTGKGYRCPIDGYTAVTDMVDCSRPVHIFEDDTAAARVTKKAAGRQLGLGL